MWPYKIETDPENPLKWYYPFTASFWCGRGENDEAEGGNRVSNSYKSNLEPDEENNLLEPLQGKRSRGSEVTRNLPIQSAEKKLIEQGILEVPAQCQNESVGKLVITDLSKRYGDK